MLILEYWYGYKVELNKYALVGVSYKVRMGEYMRVFK